MLIKDKTKEAVQDKDNEETRGTIAGKWLSAWGTSPVDFYISLQDFVKKNLTLINVLHPGTTTRTEITVTASGSKIRLRFSNLFGKQPVLIDEVTIARMSMREPGQIIEGTSCRITFNNGAHSLKILPGETVFSDEIAFHVSILEKLSVSMYFDRKTPIGTSGLYSAVTYTSKSSLSQVSRAALKKPTPIRLSSGSMACNIIPFLTGLDVLSDSLEASCVVMFGDSTFCNDAYLHLEERILSAGCRTVSVVNKAISGNKLLNDGCGIIGSFYGASALERFQRDVLDLSGVTAVIVKIGVNDITHPYILSMKGKVPIASVDELVDGYIKMANAAHARGIKIYLSKIAPWNGYEREVLGRKGDLKWSRDLYKVCCDLNEWIASNDVCDGYIDTDLLSEPEDKTALFKPFTTDCMHFSPLGAIAFADLIPMSFLGVEGEAEKLLENRYCYFPREMNQRTENSGNFGEQFQQIKGFLAQLTDHMRFRMRK